MHQFFAFYCIYFSVISTPAHADSGGVTLLQTFGYPGLELMLDNKWYQVPPIEDCLVVNVGEYMSRMSNNRFKATIHRVMDIGRNRYLFFIIANARIPIEEKNTTFSGFQTHSFMGHCLMPT